MMNYYVFWTIVICIGFLIGILYLPLKINIKFIRKGDDENIHTNFYMLNGLIKHTINIPFIDIISNITDNEFIKTSIHSKTQIIQKEEDSTAIDEKKLNLNEIRLLVENIFRFRRRYFQIIKYVQDNIRIDNIYWCTRIGMEDAGDTAILCGILWGIKTNLIMCLKRKYSLNCIYTDIRPCYTEKRFDIVFDCIVALKLGYIIIAGIKIFLIRIKGGVEVERTSN